MGYEYEEEIKNHIICAPVYVDDEVFDELKEVYAKAKILNKITDILKTGRSLEDLEDVEVILLAIEHELNYISEDK